MNELPRNVDAERAVVSAVLINPEVAPVLDGLTPDNFTDNNCRRIFRALYAMRQRGEPMDAVLLKNELERQGDTKPAETLQALRGVPRTTNAEFYAQAVRTVSWRRNIITLCESGAQCARNGVTDRELHELLEAIAEQSPPGAAVKAENLNDILARVVDTTPWAVDGLIGEKEVCFLSGPAGAGKTFLVLSLVMHLAAGTDVWNRFGVSRPYKIGILDLEDSADQIDLRLQRLARGISMSPEAAARVQVIRERLRLDEPEHIGRLLRAVSQWELDFLVIDSFRRAFTGDENSSSDVSKVFSSGLDVLKSAGCGVIVTDHHRKRSGDKTLDAGEEMLRGSTDKRALLDVHIAVEPREERLALTPTKVRHGRLPEPFLVRIDGLEDDEAEVGVFYVGTIDRASDACQDAIIALFGAEYGWKPRGEIVGRLNYSARTVDGALSMLVKRGLLHKERVGRETRYKLPAKEDP